MRKLFLICMICACISFPAFCNEKLGLGIMGNMCGLKFQLDDLNCLVGLISDYVDANNNSMTVGGAFYLATDTKAKIRPKFGCTFQITSGKDSGIDFTGTTIGLGVGAEGMLTDDFSIEFICYPIQTTTVTPSVGSSWTETIMMMGVFGATWYFM